MSDPGPEVPPQGPNEGAAEGAWEPVQTPERELPAASAGEPAQSGNYPPPAGYPPPPAGASGPAQSGNYPPPNAGQSGNYPPPNAGQSGNYPPPGGYPPPPGSYPPGYAQAQPMRPTTAATIAYLTIVGAVVMLVLEPYRNDSYVRFHAWQEVLLCAVWVAGDILFGHIGGAGHWVKALLHLLLFVFWLIAIIKAGKGERYHVPVIGELAENVARSV